MPTPFESKRLLPTVVVQRRLLEGSRQRHWDIHRKLKLNQWPNKGTNVQRSCMGEPSFTTECDRDVQAELCEQPSPLEVCQILPYAAGCHLTPPANKDNPSSSLTSCSSSPGAQATGGCSIWEHWDTYKTPQEPTKNSKARQEMP